MGSVQSPSPARQLPHEQWLADTLRWTSDLDGPCPPNRDWFAIPVQLTVGLDHLVLSEVDTPITEEDGEVLAQVIESLLADSGIRLVRHRINATEVWQLHFEDGLSLEACTPLAAIGRNTQTLMPAGLDGARWRKLVHEIEMAWHCAGPDLRFASAEPFPVNSLWLAAPVPAKTDSKTDSNSSAPTAPHVTLIDPGCALTLAQIEASSTPGTDYPSQSLWIDARALQPRLLGDLEGWLEALEAIDAALLPNLPNATQLVLTGGHALSTWTPSSGAIQTPSPWSFQGLAARVLGSSGQTGQTSKTGQTSQTTQPRAAHTIFTEPT